MAPRSVATSADTRVVTAEASLSQYCRKKRFYGGYLAKFMFLKRCRILNIEPLTEFFKLAGELYDPKAVHENNLFLNDNEDSSEYTDIRDEDLLKNLKILTK